MPVVKFPGYRIEKRIGQGGMASVYLAVQESLQRRVALKVLNAMLADDDEYSQRFLNEGRIIAALSHRNIITIHDVGAAGGHHYIAMEYVEGGDLTARMTGPMQPEDAFTLVRSLGQALDFAHHAGVVHRDVKPANILFRRDGTPLLTDFGIAKRRESDLTLGGTVLGTPGYLSPEQAQGKAVDGRSDLYSLGVILYEMLVGKRPFVAETEIATIIAQLQDPVPELPERLARFQPFVNRMIAREPEARFPDMAAMLESLDALEGTRAPQRRYDRRLAVGALAGAGVAVVLAALWLTGLGQGAGVLSRDDDSSPAPSLPAPTPSTVVPRVAPAPGTAAQALQGDPSATPAPATDTAERLVALGRQALAADRLIAPPGESALEHFREALAVDAGNGAAEAGLSEIVSRFARRAEKHLAEGDFAAARKQVMSGMTVRPDHPALVALLRTANESVARVENLLALAAKAIANYRLTTPAGNNALEYYEAVLALQPGNQQAIDGKIRIARRYAQLAQDKIAHYKYADARALIRRGLQVLPGDPQLLALRGQADIKNAPGQFVKDIKGLFD